MTPTLRVLIADDDELFRESLAGVVSLEPGLTLVGEARNGLEALHQVPSVHPDLVFMDLRMPIMDGLEATRAIKSLPGPPFVVLCTAEPQGGPAVSAHGPDAFLSKTEVTDEILRRLTRSARHTLDAPAVALSPAPPPQS